MGRWRRVKTRTKTLGARIARLRREKELTQAELAQLLNAIRQPAPAALQQSGIARRARRGPHPAVRHQATQRDRSSGTRCASDYILAIELIEPAELPRVVHDPDDDHVLACALAARADLIVTGDNDLLDLNAYQDILIVTAAEALRRIEPQR